MFTSDHRRRGQNNANLPGNTVTHANVLDSDANSFNVKAEVYNSSGQVFNVSNSVLDSDGNSFTIFS